MGLPETSAGLRDIDYAILHRAHKQSRCGADLQLAHKTSAVAFDGLDAEPKMLGDLRVAETPRNRMQHFTLACRQGLCDFAVSARALYRRAIHGFSGQNTHDSVRDLSRFAGLGKHSFDTRADHLIDRTGRHISSDHDKARIRRPSPSFEDDFHTGGPRHRVVKDRAIRRMLFDQRDGGDSVLRRSQNINVSVLLQGLTHTRQGKSVIIGNDCRKWRLCHSDNPCVFARLRAVILIVAQIALLTVMTQAYADSPPVVLDGPTDRTELRGHIDAFVDPDWDYELDTVTTSPEVKFRSIDGKSANFGYTSSKIWLRTAVHNDTEDEREWVVHFHENFKQVFDVGILRRDGTVDQILSLRPDSTFSARAISYPQMAAGFTLEPGETATLIMGLWSEGSSYITYSFETQDSFAQVAAGQTAKNFIFYGMMMLLIATATVALFVFGHKVFFFYTFYIISAVLYVMHADGVAFQYLWPNAPVLNNYASVITGSGLIVFGALYARSFLRTAERHVAMDRILLAVIGVTFLSILVLLPSNPQILKKTLVFLSLIAVLTFTLSAIVAAFRYFREVRFYLFAWVGALVSVSMLNLSHIFGIEISQDFLHDSIRMVMVFDAFMMGLAIADRFNQLRQSRQMALETNLRETQRNLKLNARLGELEKQYSVVSELAESRSIQIQNTVHDLSQPLHALRMSVANLTSGRLNEPESASKIDETFTYLESLVAQQLQDGAPAPAEALSQSTDTLDTQQVLSSIHQMFEPDAEAKGLEFRFVPTSHTGDVDPLVLMRIVTNLVSNAIKYTQEGGILLGTRMVKDHLLIEVHDTGKGLSEAEFERACGRSTRLEDDQSNEPGYGFGLSIVRDLVDAHGLTMSLSKLRASGTGIVVRVPKANSNVTQFPQRGGAQSQSG